MAHVLLLLALYLSYISLSSSPRTRGQPEKGDVGAIVQWFPTLWDSIWRVREITLGRRCKRRYRLNERLAELGHMNVVLSLETQSE